MVLKIREKKMHYSLDHPRHPYRVHAEALRVGHSERVILVCDDQQVGHRVHSQSVIICPVDGADIDGERSQMSLR